MKEDYEFQIAEKTNGLGEEIAQDVNNIETRIKDLMIEINQFKGISQQAMLTLEKKTNKIEKTTSKYGRKRSKSRSESGL